MSKKRRRGGRRDRYADDDDADYILNGVAVVLGCLWLGLCQVVRAGGALVVCIVDGARGGPQRPPPEKPQQKQGVEAH